MKEAVGHRVDEGVEGAEEESADSLEGEDDDDDDDDEEGEDEGDEGGSQPLDLSSEEMRLRIIESGTRLPDCIVASASRPRAGVSNTINPPSYPSRASPREVPKLTERCLATHVLAKKVSGAN